MINRRRFLEDCSVLLGVGLLAEEALAAAASRAKRLRIGVRPTPLAYPPKNTISFCKSSTPCTNWVTRGSKPLI